MPSLSLKELAMPIRCIYDERPTPFVAMEFVLKTDSSFAWITSTELVGSSFRCETTEGKGIQTNVKLGTNLLAQRGPQPVVHIRVALYNIEKKAGALPLVEHVGGCVIAIGVFGTGSYIPSHTSISTDLPPFKFGKPVEAVPVYNLIPSADDSAQWESCRTAKTSRAVTIEGLSFLYGVYDATPQYTRRARAMVKAAREQCNLTGIQTGFIRWSEKRAGWQWCPLPGTMGIREIASVDFHPAHLQQLLRLSCVLTGFSSGVFSELALSGHSCRVDAIVRTDSAVIDSLLGLLGCFVGSAGWSVGYEAELEDDTSTSAQKLGRQSDCEDFAIAAVACFTALQQLARTHSGRIDLLSILAAAADKYFSEAVVTTGFVDLVTARPDLVDVSENAGKSGHGWCSLLVRPTATLPEQTRLRCGCGSGKPAAVFVETTTPTVLHTGVQPRDVLQTHENTPVESYNAAVVAEQGLYNGVLDLRISAKTSAIVDRFGKDGFNAATFLARSRYLTVAFEASLLRSAVICADSTPRSKVGVTAARYCSGRCSRYALNGDTAEYDALFAPLDLKNADLTATDYSRGERLLGRVADRTALPTTFRGGPAGCAFLVDTAMPELLLAAQEHRAYLGSTDKPWIEQICTGHVVVLPGE